MVMKSTAGVNVALTERHNCIMEELRRAGSASVASLAARLRVSEVTIRKDLSLLERRNMLYRAHGMAILIDPYINDRHVNEKEKLFAGEKWRIGVKAARLITPNDTILIASGTTVQALAREIVPQESLTAITAALNVATILTRHKEIDVIQLGGTLRNSSVSAVGPYAEAMLGNFSCSKLFLGVDGINLDYGLSTTNLMEANLNRRMIDCVQKVIVLTDSSKFGRKGFSKICDICLVNQIITDGGIPPHIHEQLIDQGIEITIV